MDEGTAGEIAEINNKGIIAMCLITSWGRTSLGQRAELAESFWSWALPRSSSVGAGGCPKTQPALGWSALGSLLVAGGTLPARGPHPVTATVPGEPGQPAGLDQPQPRLQPRCHRQARAGRRLPGPDLAAGTELRPEHSRALCPASRVPPAPGKRCHRPEHPQLLHLPAAA